MVAKAKKTRAPGRGRPSLGTEDPFTRHGGKPLRANHGWLFYYATEPLYISVKQQHIDSATTRSTNVCVIALAGSDMWGDKFEIEVSCTQFRVIDTAAKKRLTFTIPGALRKRLREFDKFDFWDLPPGLYRIDPTPKPKKPSAAKNKKTVIRYGAKHSAGNGTLVIGTRPTLKRKKHRASPTRFVSHGRIVWSKKKRKTRAA